MRRHNYVNMLVSCAALVLSACQTVSELGLVPSKRVLIPYDSNREVNELSKELPYLYSWSVKGICEKENSEALCSEVKGETMRERAEFREKEHSFRNSFLFSASRFSSGIKGTYNVGPTQFPYDKENKTTELDVRLLQQENFDFASNFRLPKRVKTYLFSVPKGATIGLGQYKGIANSVLEIKAASLGKLIMSKEDLNGKVHRCGTKEEHEVKASIIQKSNTGSIEWVCDFTMIVNKKKKDTEAFTVSDFFKK
jgi:hypothetical protein